MLGLLKGVFFKKMRFQNIALKLNRKSYTQVADLLETIIAGFVAQVLIYPLPPITTLVATGQLTTLRSMISAWRPVGGNRGSHQDLLNVRDATNVAIETINVLALYAETTTPTDRTAINSLGFTLRQIPRRSVGTLEAVQNFRQFISRKIDSGTLKLNWKKPLNAVNLNVNGYHVRRGTTSDFDQSVVIATVTRTSYLDMNPGTGYKFYWVVPFNASGLGVKSDSVMAIATPIP